MRSVSLFMLLCLIFLGCAVRGSKSNSVVMGDKTELSVKLEKKENSRNPELKLLINGAIKDEVVNPEGKRITVKRPENKGVLVQETWDKNKDPKEIVKIFPKSKSGNRGKGFQSLSRFDPPDWVTYQSGILPVRKGNFIYGVGMNQQEYNKTNIIKDSENAARKDLVHVLSLFKESLINDFKRETDRYPDINREDINGIMSSIELSTAMILSQSKIIETWKHPEQDRFYTLVELNLDILRQQIKNLEGSSLRNQEIIFEVYNRTYQRMKENSNNQTLVIRNGREFGKIEDRYLMY